MSIRTRTRAFVDIDEPREQPVRHRYVHGGFEDTDTRFSAYFPPAELWQGRFFSSIEGGAGGHETRAASGAPGPGSIAFASAMGAYLVETNNGHTAPSNGSATRGPADPALTTYEANASSARYLRDLGAAMYGRPPVHGYVFGPSGGGWRTVLCVENVGDVWDGSVPFISGMGGGINFPSLVANVARALGPALAAVVDSQDPGGSGDSFATLNGEQRLELGRLYRAGLQPGAEFGLRSELAFRVMRVVGAMHDELDPTYVDDFWRLPGYAGADGALASARVQLSTRVIRVRSRDTLVIDERPSADPRGAVVRVISGAARGATAVCSGLIGDALVLDVTSPDDFAGLAVGDRVELDNRRYLAFCHLYRHQIDAEYPEAAQLMVDGAPIYPQRSVSVADALTGVPLSGRFHGKMIYVANLKDTATSPVSGAIGYRARVRTHSGADGEARLRTWFVDNASHVSGSRMPQGEPPVTSSRLVDWDGCIERALAHLIGWVEAGIAPPADSGFTYRDGRVELAARADDRGGIQAVVALTAAGSDRASVDPGATVTLEVSAQTPPGTGSVAAVEWDFEGDGNWIAGPASGGDLGTRIKAAVDHVYARRGTFFPSVRVTTHPGAGTDERFCRVTNVARARVVVGDGHGQR